MIARYFAVLISICSAQAWAEQTLEIKVSTFNQLQGWSIDDHNAALSVFVQTCPDLKSQDWQTMCAIAQHTKDGKTFFKPVLISDGSDPLFTGYYEPELIVSRVKTAKYQFPIYRAPNDLPKSGKWFTRQQIVEDKILSNRGLEIAWASDPVDVFFLQIQGSGRLRFTDGSSLRIGYGGSNGHKYRSVGKEMVRRGTYDEHQVSATVIKGAQRADIFIGSGDIAGREAAKIKDKGSIYVLLPIKRALSLISQARQ